MLSGFPDPATVVVRSSGWAAPGPMVGRRGFMSEVGREPRILGVLVTYRRRDQLAATLRAIAGQTRPLDRLLVVDNAPEPGTDQIVQAAFPGAEYLPAPENLGPAGGIALGMQRLLGQAAERDWIMTLDDDDPPRDPTVFATLASLACRQIGSDPSTAAVGLSGVRFDDRRGRIVRVPDAELHGAVSVDSIAGNQFPCYSVRAIRAVGTMRADLFFGFEELELGLRLRDHGYTLYAPGALWYSWRATKGFLGRTRDPSWVLGPWNWRRYYSLRNLVRILRDRGATAAALRVTIVTGLAKPVANLVREPVLALRHLGMNARACRDAWTGRMGRTVEPAR